MTGLKDVKETIVNISEPTTTVPRLEYGTSIFSFTGYYDSVKEYRDLSSLDQNQKQEQTASYKTYVLEAAVYDLKRTKDKQLVATTIVEVAEPKSAIEVRSKFVKAIKKLF